MNPEKTKKYKIAINTRLLLTDKLEGIGWFTFNVLQIIATQHPEHTFYFIFDRPFDNKFIFSKNVVPIIASPPARHPILWYIWYEWAIPRVLKKVQADIFISMDSYTSLRASIPKLTVVHDIAFVFYDHQMPWLTQWYMRYFTPKFIASSNKIITVSNSTKTDIMSVYKTPEDKISIAYNAPSDIFKPIDTEVKNQFKVLKTNGQEYFIYVGSIHPRKNIINLLKAFEIYKTYQKDAIKLVIVGRIAWQFSDVMSYYDSMLYKEDVILVSHSSQVELSQWVAAALCLVFVPLYEGFGIPLVEAMACHTPIICSDNSSMPEVVGDAAIIVDALNPFEIAQAMIRVANDTAERNMLVSKGIQRKSQFNWQQTADKIWNTIVNI